MQRQQQHQQHQQSQQQHQPQQHQSQQLQHSMLDIRPSSSSPFDQARVGALITGDPSQQQLIHGQPQHVVLHGHRQSEEHISQHIQHQLSRNAQTLSPGQSSEPRKISPQDIQQVQNLIERCLQLHMNKKEVISTLLNQAKIEPNFTGLVWQKLEEQNPDFFRAYYIRLTVKQQILRFNQLLEKQASIMERMATTNAPSVSNGLHSSAGMKLGSDCFVSFLY